MEEETEFRFESCVCAEDLEGKSGKEKELVNLDEKRCYCGGLTEEQVKTLENVKESKKQERYVRKNFAVLLFHAFWNFTSWLVELSCICSISINKHQVAPPSWQEFLIIFVAFLFLLSFSCLAELYFSKLWPTIHLDWCVDVIRNAGWICVDEKTLVPGDVICLRKGDVFPAEVLVLRSKNAILCNILEDRRVEIYTTSAQRRVETGTIVLSGEVTGCISSLPVREYKGDSSDIFHCDWNGFHSVTSSLFVPLEASLLCFAALFAALEIIIMFAVQHRTHETVVLDVLILLTIGTPWYLFFFVAIAVVLCSYQFSTCNAPVVKKVSTIVELSNIDKVLFGIERTLTCDNPPCIESEVFAMNPYTTEQVLNACRKTIYPESVTEEGNSHCVVACDRPGYQNIVITDVSGHRHSYFVGHVSVIESLCALSDAEKSNIENGVKRFAESRLYPFAVAEKRNDDQETASSSHVEQDFVSPLDIHKNHSLVFMGMVPLNYCPSEEAKYLVESLKALNISVMVTGYSQKYLLEKICDDFGLESSEAIFDPPLYPSSALLNAFSIENMSSEEVDIQSAVHDELMESLDAPILKHTAVIGCTYDHILLTSRGILSISHPKAVAAVKLTSQVITKESDYFHLSWLISFCRYATKMFNDYAQTACIFAAYFCIMTAVLTYGWAFDYSLFVAVIVLFCFLGETLCICGIEIWNIRKQGNVTERNSKPIGLDFYELFIRSILLSIYSALSSIIFYLLIHNTHVWSDSFHLSSLSLPQIDSVAYAVHRNQQRSAMFMQSGVFSLSLVYFIRTDIWKIPYGYLSLLSGVLFMLPIIFIGVYANWSFAHIASIGWAWFLAVLIYNIIWLIPFEVWKRVSYRSSKYIGLANLVTWVYKQWQNGKHKLNILVQRLE
ncbi:H+-transporting P-type ATPase [Galdieria sulphuraria]|uniref:H+-transporting P-type ATPase n=1 Tax=Galdieria sulphuraria TaxID=130081 RepID=M2Y128_GALSU|nr:H+-transporting P-type ATPase [Galdieria sulphuraria]EME29519.1 H+-transporting P-type ATPase [Galdieria sulphuraria]|eukprot:XP_005706039.1 H+-transporting P-type ATPase [Galdieria sulphuraria]